MRRLPGLDAVPAYRAPTCVPPPPNPPPLENDPPKLENELMPDDDDEPERLTALCGGMADTW